MNGRHLARAAVTIAALALAGTTALPATAATTAFADVGTCSVVGTELRYTADAGVDNDVLIRAVGANIQVQDGAGEVAVGTGCANAGGNATAPAGNVAGIRVTTLDGDDTVRVTTFRTSAIIGGPGSDELTGGPLVDDLRGGGGEDDLRGGNGDDLIQGGGDNDEIRGGNGADDLGGGAGDDDVRGGAGTDDLSGGAGNDDLYGNAGNDELYGNAGNDELDGGSGTDSCNGGSGTDTERNCE